jgi:signal transduction histidine kinase
VRRVADHHEARLNIFSAPGQGTRIVITIPEHRVASVREVA